MSAAPVPAALGLGARRGLLVDYGGVLTTDPFASFEACGVAEGLAPGAVRAAMAPGGPVSATFAELERGALGDAEFERRFAGGLGLAPERAAGLRGRLFAGMRSDHATRNLVRALRALGVRTALLSNSAGTGGYDRELLAELFDDVVISGDVGLRKPDPAIYRLAARRLELPPDALVLVDDLEENLVPARALGIAGVLHRDAASTAAELQELLGLRLPAALAAR
ncbi:MAG: family hydrolase [Conexibacter sp.]|nr:family hydrolase [Conexibacter sp.]